MPIATTCCSSRWRYTTQLGGKCWGHQLIWKNIPLFTRLFKAWCRISSINNMMHPTVDIIRSKFSLNASNIWHSWFPLFLQNLHPKLSLELPVELFSPLGSNMFFTSGSGRSWSMLAHRFFLVSYLGFEEPIWLRIWSTNMNIVDGPIPWTSLLKLQLPVPLRTELFGWMMDGWWCCGCCRPGGLFVLMMMMMMMMMMLMLMLMFQLLIMMVVIFFGGEERRFQFCEPQELIEVREDDCGNRVSCQSRCRLMVGWDRPFIQPHTKDILEKYPSSLPPISMEVEL